MSISGIIAKFCLFFAEWRRQLWWVACFLLVTGCSGPGRLESIQPAPEISGSHRQEIVLTALSLAGSPYRYGGTDPVGGFDCSGLVNYVFQQVAGARLPRSANQQAAATRRIQRRDLREGDLVFFNTLGRANSHVGIYVGEGRFVNAPSSGGHVRIDRLDSPYFSKRFDSARTLFASR